MYSFKNDYNVACHPSIIKRLNEINESQFVGYGIDEICNQAKTKIQNLLNNKASIHFVSGGTQANLIVISSLLRPYEGVISSVNGHINVHETGAIEACGHKVIALQDFEGKLRVSDVEKYLDTYSDEVSKEHLVKPGMVYISNPTELGTLYSKEELTGLYKVCKKNNILLFIDGARLAYALSGLNNDILFSDYGSLCDIFYIGATKCGAMFGEAIVINNPDLDNNFRYNIKQKGGLLAKGFLLGLQFDELFSNNLYYDLGKHGNEIAEYISDNLNKLGIKMYMKRYTNQIFVILNNIQIEALEKDFIFETWEKIDENTRCIRLVVSWSTSMEWARALVDALSNICV